MTLKAGNNIVATGAFTNRPLCARRADHLPVMAEVVDKQLVPLQPPFFCKYCEQVVDEEGVLL